LREAQWKAEDLVLEWQAELLADWRAELELARADRPHYERIRFRRGLDGEGLKIDENRVNRAKVLWALQYERQPADLELVRTVLREEIAWHREAPFQGLADELTLAAYLVAQDSAPDDLELMWLAKTANFDAWCGFDIRFLGIGGVETAIRAARSQEPPDDDLLSKLIGSDGAPAFSDDNVDAHLRELAATFPTAPDDEAPASWFSRARLAGDFHRARLALDAWAASASPPSASGLQHSLGTIGCFNEAVQVQQQVVANAGGIVNDVLAGIRLAELQRQAGQLEEGFTTIRACRQALRRVPDDNGFLRRRVAEEGFLLATAASGRLASKAFRLADEVAQDRTIRQVVVIKSAEPSDEWLPLVVLEAGRDAAEHVQDAARADAYARRAARERARIDTALGR
jgi:hypothetical protein